MEEQRRKFSCIVKGKKISDLELNGLLDDCIEREISESRKKIDYHTNTVNSSKYTILGGTTVMEILTKIQSNFSEYDGLINTIKNVIYDEHHGNSEKIISNIYIVFSNLVNVSGLFQNINGEMLIILNPEHRKYQKNAELVILNKIIHSMISLALNNPHNDILRRGIEEFMKYIKSFANNMNVNKINIFTNAEEFLSCIETRRSFKYFLNSIPPMQNNTVNNINDDVLNFLMTKIFNVKKYDSVYDELVSVLCYVMEEQSNHFDELFADQHSFFDFRNNVSENQADSIDLNENKDELEISHKEGFGKELYKRLGLIDENNNHIKFWKYYDAKAYMKSIKNNDDFVFKIELFSVPERCIILMYLKKSSLPKILNEFIEYHRSQREKARKYHHEISGEIDSLFRKFDISEEYYYTILKGKTEDISNVLMAITRKVINERLKQ